MNKIMTVKFEKDIGISDEEKNKLRYTLVLHFMEQLKQKGMYKVEEEKHDGKWVISASLVMPTIEAEPVNTDKCKALRNIEGIRLILSNVYNTGSTLQDCDYDAIYKRLDVIENILKGK